MCCSYHFLLFTFTHWPCHIGSFFSAWIPPFPAPSFTIAFQFIILFACLLFCVLIGVRLCLFNLINFLFSLICTSQDLFLCNNFYYWLGAHLFFASFSSLATYNISFWCYFVTCICVILFKPLLYMYVYLCKPNGVSH